MAPGDGELERVDCAVIIVTYNSAGDLESLLNSIPAGAPDLRMRVVVVDNDSSDGTWEQIEQRPDVVGVQTGANLGYAGAINVGRLSAGPYDNLLILNPDLVLEAGAVSKLWEVLQHPGVGATVPKILDQEGALYPSLRREPSLLRALGDACLGSRGARRPGWLTEQVRNPSAYEWSHDVDWSTGAAILISGPCDATVGPWDAQRFFLYSEETDFAARARTAGYRIAYVPEARVRHRQGGSGGPPALTALMAVNRVRYYEKHHQRFAASAFRCIVILTELLRCRDPAHRTAVRSVLRRSRWSALPGGIP